jgi:transcriptional regulator with XRE-family HTH domain
MEIGPYGSPSYGRQNDQRPSSRREVAAKSSMLELRLVPKFEKEPGVADVLRELGKQLRDDRYREGFTQDTLAYHSGVDQGTISRLERGLAPGLRFASYARLRQILGSGARRDAKIDDFLAEFWAGRKPPWEMTPEERYDGPGAREAASASDNQDDELMAGAHMDGLS